jgi:hypothetical protein
MADNPKDPKDSEDPKNEPVFEVAEGSVTRLHGTEVPRGFITIGSSVSEAKAPSPDQSALVVNGAYSFAKLLSET